MNDYSNYNDDLGFLGIDLKNIDWGKVNWNQVGKQVTGVLGFPKVSGGSDESGRDAGSGISLPAPTQQQVATQTNTHEVAKLVVIGGGVVIGSLILLKLLKRKK